MSFQYPLRRTQLVDYSTPTDPGRQPSTASTSSSAYSNSSNSFDLSRTSTLSSTTSSGYRLIGHKRGLSEAANMAPHADKHDYSSSTDNSPAGTYRSMRQSLRPLPQPPSDSPPARKSPHGHARSQTLDIDRKYV